MQYEPAASIRSGAQWQAAALHLGRRGIEAAICAVLMLGAPTLSAWAQDAAPATAAAPDNDADASAPADYTTEQLDALLAPIALYPDQLLTQILMASAYPLQIVEAYRWQQQPANSALTGDALATALEQQSWDPSVKSLVPFPQVLSTMNDKLDWVQQLGYAVENQESDVMDSVQRLRQQAQAAGQLQSNAQQVVSTENQAIIIAPAQPNVVYVPAYNPTVVYGGWPYPAYPPVYWPPPPGYALASGIAFGVGIAVTASLWGWARPGWGYGGYHGNINVNVNRYNNINVNRTQIHNSNWKANRPAGAANRPMRPPGGPVGKPGRPGGGLPANAIGRDKVKVPGNITKPPGGIGGNRPGNGGANRPGNGAGNRRGGNNPGGGMSKPGGGNKPALGGGNKPALGGGNKPAGGGARPNAPGGGGAKRPSGGAAGGGNRQPGAFSGMNQGKSASQFGDRGAQSRSAGGFGGGGGGGGGRTGGGGGGRRR